MASGVGPQELKLPGATERLTLDVLTLAVRVMPVALGLQVNESSLMPMVPAGKVIVTGLTSHVACGDEVVANPTAA